MTVAELIQLLDHDGVDPNAQVGFMDHMRLIHVVEVVADGYEGHILLMEERTKTDAEMIRSKPR